jgi:hypothetical protein
LTGVASFARDDAYPELDIYMLNEAVHMGLIKALVFANALKEHDPECEWVDQASDGIQARRC